MARTRGDGCWFSPSVRARPFAARAPTTELLLRSAGWTPRLQKLLLIMSATEDTYGQAIVFKRKLKLERRPGLTGEGLSFQFCVNKAIWSSWDMKDKINDVLRPL